MSMELFRLTLKEPAEVGRDPPLLLPSDPLPINHALALLTLDASLSNDLAPSKVLALASDVAAADAKALPGAVSSPALEDATMRGKA